MTDYVPPDPSEVECFQRMHEEMRQYQQQIEHLDDQELMELVSDRKQASILREVALHQLVHQRGRKESLTDRLRDLLDDPDPRVAAKALFHCPLTDERSLEKARRMSKSTNYSVRGQAVIALGKAGDQTLLPQLLEWFAGDEKRELAIEGLVALATEEAKLQLKQGYEQGGCDDRDRAMLAIALLRLKDERGVDFLKTVAKRARGDLSVAAANWLYCEYDADIGLQLMLHILDDGDGEAKCGMVQQIPAHLPHQFTADGIHEARLWVQQKLSTA